jgi:predicted DNA-binding transcriptional regulator AlpA
MDDMKERLVIPEVVANHLGVSCGQLAQMRYLGTGPEFIKIGSRVRYRMSAVSAWLDSQTRTQTGVAS